MAPRSKKIRAPSDYFLWAPQEQGVQSKICDFCERHSRRGARRKVAALFVYIIDFIFPTNRI